MNTILKQLKRKGKLNYTYLPLKNYRIIDEDKKVSFQGGKYKYYKEGDKYYIIVNKEKKDVTDFVTNENDLSNTNENNQSDDLLIGSIKNLTNNDLNFNINYPVDIEVLESYDKSVNLILNDNYNKPRMINSRFTVKDLNTYEIIDREGLNDTNLYDDKTFDLDTSLYKVWNKIPKVKYNGTLYGGDLKVGNYVFYFKYADADGNETDFIELSGIVSIFIGNDSDPFSINGGFKNMNSNKGVQFNISNIDQAYDYLIVYYTRSYADILENRVTSAYRIEKKFPLHTNTANILIFGNEITTEVPLSDINIQYFIANKAQTQAQCSNRLFLGGVSKPEIDYKDFSDISLRILPTVTKSEAANLIGSVDLDTYRDSTLKYEYYNTDNIYNYVGYWPEEIYRFGVVYILEDNTRTPVFNVRGISDLKVLDTNDGDVNSIYTKSDLWDDNSKRSYIQIDEESKLLINGKQNKLENSKGVVKIQSCENDCILRMNFHIPEEVLTYLKVVLKVKGLIFVRQKRIPTILALALLLPVENISHTPLLYYSNKYMYETFFDKNGLLTHNYQSRLRDIKTQVKVNLNNQLAAICPEFELNLPYYNLFFTGSSYIMKIISNQNQLSSSNRNNRLYKYLSSYSTDYSFDNVNIISVTENVPTVAIGNKIFLLNCGEAEDTSKFEFVETENKDFDKKDGWNNLNVIRGIFGPYLGITTEHNLVNNYFGRLVNIYISGYSENNIPNYFLLRYLDDSTYYAISDSVELDDIKKTKLFGYPTISCYRGDSYLCNYTHRLNRNFNDPSSPSNDKIVDYDTWKDNYDSKKEGFYKMNRGDINAIQLGSWITFKVRSSSNLSIRSVDDSNVAEKAVMGTPRTFYPYSLLLAKGNNKLPESSVLNDGFRSTVGERWYQSLPEVPYYKNTFENRVIYSEIAITDAFKNGYRVFYSTNFLDYKKEYGKIIKLVELQGNLLCVFERAVGVLMINEKAALTDSNGGEVFINTRNVLPDEPRVLSDSIGSLWKESIIKTPYYVYGVDTRAKKIWRTNGTQIEIISDLKVNKFLVDNITLSEFETNPISGIKNVKSHYNANKSDVMFTFYDGKIDEKAWNLCYNEILLSFVTFYSWIPSYSANIQNQFWSFDRTTSKNIGKLGLTYKYSNIASGLILEPKEENNEWKIIDFVGAPEDVTFFEIELLLDSYGSYRYFSLVKDLEDLESKFNNYNIIRLKNIYPDKNIVYLNFYIKAIKATLKNNQVIVQYIIPYYTSVPIQINQQNLSHDFWVHGRAGIYNELDEILPTKWYGTQHPFEFEFVVNEDVFTLKIFTNLLIISNKAEPESFHFEIVGENYEWSKDKKNIYYRLEALKELASRFGYNIHFNSDYTKITPKFNPLLDEEYYNHVYGKDYYSLYHKSILFPLYYFRNDLMDEIYDKYYKLDYPNRTLGTYNGLTGTEIGYNKDKSEFRVLTHVLNLPIEKYGIRKGNSSYNEDEWRIQIPSIYFKLKDESEWTIPPIVVSDFPKTFDNSLRECNESFTPEVLPKLYLNIYNSEDCTTFNKVIDNTEWSNIKETKIRDKYIKIRVRYSGKDLAIITGIITLYNESHA